MKRTTLLRSDDIEAILVGNGIEIWDLKTDNCIKVPEWLYQVIARRYSSYVGIPFDNFWNNSDPPIK